MPENFTMSISLLPLYDNQVHDDEGREILALMQNVRKVL